MTAITPYRKIKLTNDSISIVYIPIVTQPCLSSFFSQLVAITADDSIEVWNMSAT
jgi:hypothetical protein